MVRQTHVAAEGARHKWRLGVGGVRGVDGASGACGMGGEWTAQGERSPAAPFSDGGPWLSCARSVTLAPWPLSALLLILRRGKRCFGHFLVDGGIPSLLPLDPGARTDSCTLRSHQPWARPRPGRRDLPVATLPPAGQWRRNGDPQPLAPRPSLLLFPLSSWW